jgi:hypothetical protein
MDIGNQFMVLAILHQIMAMAMLAMEVSDNPHMEDIIWDLVDIMAVDIMVDIMVIIEFLYLPNFAIFICFHLTDFAVIDIITL